ncbi:MAG: glycosyltransferase [Flavobacteriaceae bacterium]|nr:glycosyltransferase [Flavobacteriaceae bacterium]
MELKFSLIIPVYNRPKEIEELLHSCIIQTYKNDFEIIIVEDGSIFKSDEVLKKYENQLNINYFFKENSGAGASRNYGMQQATGNYFIILDSDVLLPTRYLEEVQKTLTHQYTDAFGGSDAAHESFTAIQKAINYSMTSLLTTGGIRGKKKSVDQFQPRSFNMGISKKAFEATNGFSNMKYGEDIDLSLRLQEMGFESQLISTAFVYHKRRSTFKQFLQQTYNFGTARPVLNRKFPKTAKITYWFPSLFIIGFLLAIIAFLCGYWQLLLFYKIYFVAIFIDSSIQNNNIKVGVLSIFTALIQFLGYGTGFLRSFLSHQKL